MGIPTTSLMDAFNANAVADQPRHALGPAVGTLWLTTDDPKLNLRTDLGKDPNWSEYGIHTYANCVTDKNAEETYDKFVEILGKKRDVLKLMNSMVTPLKEFEALITRLKEIKEQYDTDEKDDGIFFSGKKKRVYPQEFFYKAKFFRRILQEIASDPTVHLVDHQGDQNVTTATYDDDPESVLSPLPKDQTFQVMPSSQKALMKMMHEEPNPSKPGEFEETALFNEEEAFLMSGGTLLEYLKQKALAGPKYLVRGFFRFLKSIKGLIVSRYGLGLAGICAALFGLLMWIRRIVNLPRAPFLPPFPQKSVPNLYYICSIVIAISFGLIYWVMRDDSDGEKKLLEREIDGEDSVRDDSVKPAVDGELGEIDAHSSHTEEVDPNPGVIQDENK